MVGSTYQANLQIVQTKNSFVVRHEIMHGVRIIPVDGTPHVVQNWFETLRRALQSK